jgi:hypothetical protein
MRILRLTPPHKWGNTPLVHASSEKFAAMPEEMDKLGVRGDVGTRSRTEGVPSRNHPTRENNAIVTARTEELRQE